MKKQLTYGILFACVLALGVSGSLQAKVGGFVDAQYQWANTPETYNAFVLNDGAVYFSHEVGGSSVMVDIPFSGGLTTGNWNIATTKGQAYVAHKYDMGLSWQLGQFDKIVGMEANDTVNIPWSSQGLLWTYLPKVHVGLLATYTADKLAISGLVSDRRDTGVRNGINLEMGTKVAFDGGSWDVAVTYLGWKGAVNMEHSVDAVFGLDLGQLDIGAEFVMWKPQTLNAETAIGLGTQLVYEINDTASIGGRVELLSKFVLHNQIQLTVGPQMKLSDALTAKFDYTLTSMKLIDGMDATTAHGVVLAGVFQM